MSFEIKEGYLHLLIFYEEKDVFGKKPPVIVIKNESLDEKIKELFLEKLVLLYK